MGVEYLAEPFEGNKLQVIHGQSMTIEDFAAEIARMLGGGYKYAPIPENLRRNLPKDQDQIRVGLDLDIPLFIILGTRSPSNVHIIWNYIGEDADLARIASKLNDYQNN